MIADEAGIVRARILDRTVSRQPGRASATSKTAGLPTRPRAVSLRTAVIARAASLVRPRAAETAIRAGGLAG
eukprot:scaffold42702_cov40-Prasinocladus_malaysianus.AAC.1